MNQESESTQPVPRYFGQINKLVRTRMHPIWTSLGLYRGQNEILFVLWHEEGMTQTELAFRTRVAPATITNSLQRMQRDGWIVRQPDPEDQRISRVYLTEQGRALHHTVQAAIESLEQDMMQGFDKEEQRTLAGLLERVIENLVSAHEQSLEEA